MVANVPLWVTSAVLSNGIGLVFILSALARLGWKPFESLQRLLCCCLRTKRGAESGVVARESQFQSHSVAKGQNSIFNGGGDGAGDGDGAAETLEDGKPTSTSTTTAASGLSLAFLRARARAVSGLTKDDAGSSSPQEFQGGVLSQPWLRGCGCEVNFIGVGIEGGHWKQNKRLAFFFLSLSTVAIFFLSHASFVGRRRRRTTGQAFSLCSLCLSLSSHHHGALFPFSLLSKTNS